MKRTIYECDGCRAQAPTGSDFRDRVYGSPQVCWAGVYRSGYYCPTCQHRLDAAVSAAFRSVERAG